MTGYIREKSFNFSNRQVDLKTTVTGGEDTTGPLKGHWYSSLPNLPEGKRKWHKLRYQLYRGNPKLIGKDWDKNGKNWVKCPINKPILELEDFINGVQPFINLQTGKWFTQHDERPLADHWIADTGVIFKVNDLGFMSMTFKDNRRNVQEYYYHSPGVWRGKRDVVKFQTENQHRVVNTNKEIKPQPGNSWDYNNLTSEDRLFLFDNDYGIWVTEGNNGFMTFNHLHKFNRATFHDDYANGHWVCGMEFRGNNNAFIYNWHAQTKWQGDLAADTWGPVFKVVGEGNIVIFNVYDTVLVEFIEKLGDDFFAVDNWEKNLVILNMFDSGRLRPNKPHPNFIIETNNQWKEEASGIGAILNRNLGTSISDSIDRHHNNLRYPASVKQDIYLPKGVNFNQVKQIEIHSLYTFPDCDLDVEGWPSNVSIRRRTDGHYRRELSSSTLLDEIMEFVGEVRLERPIVLKLSEGWKYKLSYPIEYPAPTFFRQRYYTEYVGVSDSSADKVTLNYFRMFKPKGVNLSHDTRRWDPHDFLHNICGLGDVRFFTEEGATITPG